MTDPATPDHARIETRDVRADPPRPQRAHRDPVAREPPSARLSPTAHLAALATRLTPRDLWLLAMLHEHRVLTTHAIAHMAFPSDHRARRRLLELHRWDVLERFAPRLPVGAAPMHYVLGPAGAAVLAAQHGLPLRALGLPPRRGAGHRAPPHPRPHRRRQRPVRPPHPPHRTTTDDRASRVQDRAARCGWTAGGPRPAAAATSTTSAPTPTPASPPPASPSRRAGAGVRVVPRARLRHQHPRHPGPQTRPLRPPRRHHPTPPGADLVTHPGPRSPRPPTPRPRPADRRARAGAGRDLDRRDRRPPPTRPPPATAAASRTTRRGPADQVWLPLDRPPRHGTGRPRRARPPLARLARQHPRRRGRQPRPAPTLDVEPADATPSRAAPAPADPDAPARPREHR